MYMYYFIVNPNASSGKGIQIWNKLIPILQNENIPYSVHFTKEKGHASTLARQICTEHHPCTVIAVGGDGTVDEVVDGLCCYDDIVFGYIPTGSANDTVRGLHLCTDPVMALHTILHPKQISRINLGLINNKSEEHKFMVSAGIGYDAEVCHEAFRSRFKKTLNKIKLGKLTYVLLAIKKLLFLHTFTMTYTTDNNESITYDKTVFIVGMNLQYEGGGLKLCPNAQYDDDLLDICIVEQMPRPKLLCILPLGFKGKHTGFKGIHIEKCKKVCIKTSIPTAVHTDGENWGMQTEIEMSVLPEKLQMIIS